MVIVLGWNGVLQKRLHMAADVIDAFGKQELTARPGPHDFTSPVVI